MIDILSANTSTRNYLVYYTHSNSRIKWKQELLFWIEKESKSSDGNPIRDITLSIAEIFRITKHRDLNRSSEAIGRWGTLRSRRRRGLSGSLFGANIAIQLKPRLRIIFQLKIRFGVIGVRLEIEARIGL